MHPASQDYFYVSGYYSSVSAAGPFDLLIAKIEASTGYYLAMDGGWVITYGGSGNDLISGMLIDSASRYLYLVGSTTSFPVLNTDLFLAKIEISS